MNTGVIVFAHGSSLAAANDAVRAMANDVARKGGLEFVEAAFLEQAHPDLGEAVAALAEQGASRIVIVPYFLTPGVHLTRDLPRMVEELSRKYQKLELRVTAPLDGHPSLADIVLDRVRSLAARS